MDRDVLLPAQFASFLGVKERRGRQLLAELELVGFALESDNRGARLIPRKVAEAAKAAHQGGKEFASLTLNPALTAYLRRDARGAEVDPLGVLIYVGGEIGICREAIAVLSETLTTGASRNSYRALSYANAGLPDPRNGL